MAKLVRMPYDEYRSHPAINITNLKDIRRSPLHYKTYRSFKTETESMAFGTAMHHFLLENKTFDDEYEVYEGRKDKRIKAYQEFLDSGKKPLSPKEMSQIREMEGVLRYSMGDDYPFDGDENELCAFFQVYGQECKARIDCINDGVVYDYKTTTDASFDNFSRSIIKYGYHMQAFWYRLAVASVKPIKRFVFVCQEKSPPYAVSRYVMSDDMYDHAGEQIFSLMETYSKTVAQGKFPGYPRKDIEIDLPYFLRNKKDD